jgi:hypothetical protein
MHTLLCISTAAKIIAIISSPIVHSAARQVERRAPSPTFAFLRICHVTAMGAVQKKKTTGSMKKKLYFLCRCEFNFSLSSSEMWIKISWAKLELPHWGEYAVPSHTTHTWWAESLAT